ncbi:MULTISPECIES: hypothetical protein [Microbacterium]|uniref:hypothetical protein n=1 Tax=Microbacterium TaxID=33882 RepID=UPI0027D886FA|nr:MULTISPECIES: hypothetical protein [Microbacterium]
MTLVIAVGTIMFLGGAASATSAEPTNSKVTTAAQDANDAVAEIDQQSAKSGQPSWTEEFNLAVDKIRADYPDSFGGSLVYASQAAGRVWFVGNPPDEIAGYFSSIKNVVVEGGASVSEKTLYQAASDTMDQLFVATGGEINLVTYPEPQEAKVVVELPAGSQEKVEEILSTTARKFLPEEIAVELHATDDFSPAEPELFHGARPLGGVCTGAFPVKRKGGNELGIFTAAHCPGTGSYDGTSDAFFAPYAYSISTASGPGGGDFRWNHSKYGLSGLTFVAGNQSMRVFDSYAVPSVGSGICGYGKQTDYKCNTVAQCGLSATTTVPDNNQQYTVGGLCRVTGHVTTGGDSGGPWFMGRTANGIHYGKVNGHSAFSLVSNALVQTRVNLVVDSAGNTVQ